MRQPPPAQMTGARTVATRQSGRGTLAKLAIPLSILPLVAAGLLWAGQRAKDQPAKPAAASAAACHHATYLRVALGEPARLPSHPVVVTFTSHGPGSCGSSGVGRFEGSSHSHDRFEIGRGTTAASLLNWLRHQAVGA